MSGDKLEDAKEASKLLVDQMGTQDEIGLVTFDADAQLSHPLSTDKQSLKTKIDSIKAGHGTNIAEAITTADEMLMSRHNGSTSTPVIILLSDGRVSKGGSPENAANIAKQHGIRIITIGLGNNADEDELRRIATSPNDYFFSPTTSELKNIYQGVVKMLHPCN